MVRTDVSSVVPNPNPVLLHPRADKYDSATRVSRIQRFGCSGTPMAEKIYIPKTIRSSADDIFSPGCLRPRFSRPLRERRDYVCESSALCPRLKHFGLTFRVTCSRNFFPLLLLSLSRLSSSTGTSHQRPPISDQNRWRNQMVCVSTHGGDPTNCGRGCT